MPIAARLAALLLFVFVLAGSAPETPLNAAPAATLVLLKGRIRTLDGDRTAEALACRGERIVYVGTNAGARALAGPDTQVIDLHGATAVPGLTDAHFHLIGLGTTQTQLDLSAVWDRAALLARIREYASAQPAGAWVQGRGWDQTRWTPPDFPTAADLDAVTVGHPAWLRRVDGHAGWANTAALRAAGVTKDTPDPSGGKIHRDAQGNPAGVFVDRAMALIDGVMPEPAPEQTLAAIEAGQQICLRYGLTGIHDCGNGSATLELFKRAEREGRLQMRMYVMARGPGTEMEKVIAQRPYRSGLLTIRCVKFVMDGALGSRGAALLAPYSDDPGNEGLLLIDPLVYGDAVRKCVAAGWQVATHAIGDRGNRVVLDAYAEALKGRNPKAARLRVEHAQIVALDDLKRFAPLGLIASMQPTHATSDMRWAEQRVGPERIKGGYAWRTLLKAGVVIAGGSDAPVESASPALGLYAAVTRQDADGYPPGGWYPEQRMTAREALEAFTKGAAYAAFQERDLGTLTVGKLADITVFAQDPLAIPAAQLKNLTVRYTIVGGKVRYRKD